ncbi:MAG: pitrilysin family protein [Bacillota bacterium]
MDKLITLDSGLRLAVSSSQNTQGVAIGIYVKVGSSYEIGKEKGISHLIEHMFFKGTEKRNAYEISEEMESLGVNINAFTSRELTAFYTVSVKDCAENCIEMLSDMFFNSTFKEEELVKEKSVVLEEIKMCKDDPADVCFDALNQATYGNKGYGSIILGTAQSVNAITRDMILAYIEKHYIPQNTVITVAGNITVDEAVALAKKYIETPFLAKTYSKRKAFKYVAAAPSMSIKTKALAQAQVAFSFPAYNVDDDRSQGLSLIGRVLGGGMSSRLFQHLRENLGLAYSVYASPQQYQLAGSMILYIATSPETAKQAIAEMGKVIREMVENGIDSKELTKAKAQARTSVVLSAESSVNIMRQNGSRVLRKNEMFNIENTLKKIDSVSEEQIKDILKDLFDFSAVAGSYLGKKLDFDPIAVFKGEM